MWCKWFVLAGAMLWAAAVWAGEAEVSDQKSLAEWVDLLGSEDAAERASAAQQIGQLGAEAAEAVPALVKAVADPDPQVRVYAAWALARLSTDAEPAVPALIDMLDDAAQPAVGPPGWVMASYALGQIGPGAVPALAKAVQSHDPLVCRGAGSALHLIGAEARPAVPALMKVLEEGHSSDTRISAIYALKGIGPEAKAAVPLLIKALDCEDFHTQYFAAQALGAMGKEAQAAVPALRRKVKEGVASVRRHAAAALGDIGAAIGEEGVQTLIEALHDPLEPVREKAVIALSKLGALAEPAIPVIRQALAGRTLAARAQAARTLWRLTGEADEALGILMVEMDEARDPLTAAEVLGEMGPAAAPAVDVLTQRLSSRDADIRLYAARALGRIGAPAQAAIEQLKGLLEDSEKDVRQAAAEAVKKLKGQSPETDQP